MILFGDNLKVSPCIRDCSLDMILTDPPYALTSTRVYPKDTKLDEISENLKGQVAKNTYYGATLRGFMGREWDGKLPGPEVWAECYRVLKPGAFILVMASPRNDDLVSVSLREAGFVKHNKIPFIGAVPSQIFWIYSSGFPKGTDVSKAIDKKAIRAWLKERDHGLTSSEVEKVISAAVNGEANIPTHDIRCDNYGTSKANGSAIKRDRTAGARLIERIEAEFGEMPKRVKVGTRPSPRREGTVEKEKWRYEDSELSITAPATAEAAEWEGFKYGIQHLKPASEIILVFQKPYDGPPLESILKWGVGAVAVDRGRVATEHKKARYAEGKNIYGGNAFNESETVQTTSRDGDPQGRYPSNFLVSHLPGCRVVGERRVKGTPKSYIRGANSENVNAYGKGIGEPAGKLSLNYADADGRETVKEWACVEGCPVAELDRQSGELKTNPGKAATEHKPGTFGIKTKPGRVLSEGDTGGASRFFYQPKWGPADFIYIPKASSAERNAGCEGLPQKERPGCFDDDSYEWDPAKPHKVAKPAGNTHPTCKPVSLAQYLIKLYCGHNENPIILDPFAGSGWVEIAGILENVKTLSIENEWEYCEIGEARSRYWLKNRSTYLTEKRLPKYRPKLPLFEEEE